MNDKIQGQAPEASPTQDAGNGSQAPFGQGEKGNHNGANRATGRKATGPRTVQGKLRSRFNALKTGLFSKFVLMDGEAICGEYESLLNGLRDDWQPQGKSETLNVEMLGALWWQILRLCKFETAAISENLVFAEQDFFAKQHAEAWDCSRAGITSGGLLKYTNNLLVVREATQMLMLFREEFIEEGFTENCPILFRLYGRMVDGGLPPGLLMWYQSCVRWIKQAEARGDKPRDAGLRTVILEQIDAEIERLKRMATELAGFDSERVNCKLAAAFMPSQEALDSLIRQRTHLSREIDRVENRLERSQRRRKGQPPPPQVDVNMFS